MSEERYGFKLAPTDPVMDKAFGLVPFKTLDEAEHTGSKWFVDYIQYVVSNDNGMTWQEVETDDRRTR